MSESGWIQIVTLVLAALGPLAVMWVKAKLDAIKHELNSRLDEWKKESLEATTVAVEAALARGKLEGKAEAATAAPPTETTINMEVKEMQVEQLTAKKTGEK